MSIQRRITQQVICSPQRVSNLLIFNRASHSHITIHSPSHTSGLFMKFSKMRTAVHYLFNREVSRFKCVNTCKLKDSFLSKYPVICLNGMTLSRTVGTVPPFTLHSHKVQHRQYTNGHNSQQRQLILNRRPLSSISNQHLRIQLNLTNLEQRRHYTTENILCSHMQNGFYKLVLSHPTRNPCWFTNRSSLRRYCTAVSLSISDERVARYISRMKEQHQTATKQYADGTCSFKDVAQLQPLMDAVAKYEVAMEERKELQGLVEGLGPEDAELRQEAEADLAELDPRMCELEANVIELLVPPQAAEQRDIILEITAAVGGLESTLFANELFEMYQNYAMYKGWSFNVEKTSYSEVDGLRSALVRIEGVDVYACMKHELGVHCVKRIPSTESKGRIHTSTVAVAVLPIPTEIDVVIDPKDIQFTTKLASGAGGQHVQKTQSAVRLVHVPTGMAVECQEYRTQIQNKTTAMERLRAKLYNQQLQEKEQEEARQRKAQIGLVGWSDKIRTYAFQHSRAVDKRLPGSEGSRGLSAILEGGEELADLHAAITRRQKRLKLMAMIEE